MLYIICFLATILMAPFDVLVFIENGSVSTTSSSSSSPSSSVWITEAMTESSFQLAYVRWQSFNSARAITGIFGWMISCWILWRDMSRYSKLWMYLRHVRKTAILWMKRAKLLDGSDHVNGLDAQELQELIHQQEVNNIIIIISTILLIIIIIIIILMIYLLYDSLD
jgi:hypothetical protein